MKEKNAVELIKVRVAEKEKKTAMELIKVSQVLMMYHKTLPIKCRDAVS